MAFTRHRHHCEYSHRHESRHRRCRRLVAAVQRHGEQMGYRTLAYFGDYVEQSLSGVGTSDKMIRERPELVERC